MKTTSMVLLLCVLLLSVAMIFTACGQNEEPAAAAEEQAEEQEEQPEEEASPYIDTETNYQLAWGTASTSGAVYPMGAALAGLVSKYYPNINISVEATGGSVENARLIYSGDVEIGNLQGTTAFQAYTGTGSYDAYQNVLSLLQSYSNVVQFVVRADSDIQDVTDLVGKKVGVGPAGSGTEQSVQEILPLLGLTYDNYDEQFLSFTEATQAMQDGDIDAAVYGADAPTPAIMELMTNTDIRFLSLTDSQIQTVLDAHPYFFAFTIPAGTYEGIDHDVVSVADRSVFAVSADLPDAVAYMLLDAWFSHAEEANEVQGTVDFTEVKERAQVGIPLHPGAKAWYDEHGVSYPTEFSFEVY